MTLLLDTSLWIAFTRARSPAALKQFIASLEAQFATLPTLPTPLDLWQRAIALGQACRLVGRTVQRFDLLVAAVVQEHNAVLVSFDADFEAIASVSELRLKRLRRPA